MNIFTSKIYSITSASKERVFFLSSLQFSQQNAVTPTAWKSRRVTISPPSFSRHLKSSPPCIYIYTDKFTSRPRCNVHHRRIYPLPPCLIHDRENSSFPRSIVSDAVPSSYARTVFTQSRFLYSNADRSWPR